MNGHAILRARSDKNRAPFHTVVRRLGDGEVMLEARARRLDAGDDLPLSGAREGAH